MTWLASALLTLLLALPAGQVTQLCKHESGPVHVFAGSFCDGTFSHPHASHGHHSNKGRGRAHEHDHDHSGEHSQHASPGEHHEPCTHEFISTGVHLANAYASPSAAPIIAATLLPVQNGELKASRPNELYLLSEPRTRGPPGLGGALRQFVSSVRLTL